MKLLTPCWVRVIDRKLKISVYMWKIWKFVCRMFEVRMLNLWACKGLSEITWNRISKNSMFRYLQFCYCFCYMTILLLFKVCVKKNLRLLNYFSESYALTKLQNGLISCIFVMFFVISFSLLTCLIRCSESVVSSCDFCPQISYVIPNPSIS